MQAYLDLIGTVLCDGEWKHNRTGVRTKVVFGESIKHDLRNGFPLLTTKKMAWKTMLVELEGFIGGITDKRWYQKRGCKIWNEWSNPDAEYEHDLGPIYGYQWRRFNKDYDEIVSDKLDHADVFHNDQLSNVVEMLKSNPDDRRMVVSAWNPLQIDIMALPPCHLMFNLVHINGVLNLEWHQRSCDLMLGVPFNLASYATLLVLLAAEAGLEPGYVKGNFSDLHIYENHMSAANEQIKRQPRRLPVCRIDNWSNIWDWTHKDVDFADYDPMGPLKMEVAV